MDGVLVDFDAGFKEKFGCLPNDVSRRKLWKCVLTVDNYWLNLPKMPDADMLFDYVNKLGFTVLTGIPPEDFARAELEKRLWMKRYYNKEEDVICCLSKDKHKYVTKFDILIDDLEKNVRMWNKAGGIGILHTSAADTINKLKTIGY